MVAAVFTQLVMNVAVNTAFAAACLTFPLTPLP